MRVWLIGLIVAVALSPSTALASKAPAGDPSVAEGAARFQHSTLRQEAAREGRRLAGLAAAEIRVRRLQAPVDRAWIRRHPALFGAMVGFSAGFLIGFVPGDDGVLDDFTGTFNGMVLGGVGAGVGAIIGRSIGRK